MAHQYFEINFVSSVSDTIESCLFLNHSPKKKAEAKKVPKKTKFETL